MGTPQLNIDDAEITTMVDELTALTGESPTEAVRKAVKERLAHERFVRPEQQTKRDPEEIYRRLMEISEEGAKNKLPGASSDHSFLYDEFGAPI